MAGQSKRIVVKIGSNVLTRENGLPDTKRISHLVQQIAEIKLKGHEVILISSGAVASGRSLIKIDEKTNAVAVRQLLASIGQVKLINTYAQLFENHELLCAQVLVTKEDFRDRMHYLNMKNCLEILLQNNVIPVVNENDVVSVTELMFTDNDELAGLIAAMLNANQLIILSNVDGIYDADPKTKGAKVIEKVDETTRLTSFISAGKSQFGRGGMLTKANIAYKVSQLGINVHIANGITDGILLAILAEEAVHTQFVAKKSKSGKKKWIAHAENAVKGVVTINDGAKQMLNSATATSLLPVGITKINGDFKKGDIIKIVDEQQCAIGLGIAEYSIEKAKERIGEKKQKPLIHYDYLYLNI